MKLINSLEYLGVEFVSPFRLEIHGEEYQVQLLVEGFGAKNGMIVDKSWETIKSISEWLIENEYGFCCLNPEESGSLEGAQELLEDWGAYKA